VRLPHSRRLPCLHVRTNLSLERTRKGSIWTLLRAVRGRDRGVGMQHRPQPSEPLGAPTGVSKNVGYHIPGATRFVSTYQRSRDRQLFPGPHMGIGWLSPIGHAEPAQDPGSIHHGEAAHNCLEIPA
jgi:hypothetical protein